MTNIEARPRWKWDIFWWIAIAAALTLGLSGCGAAHPEPTGDGNVVDVQEGDSSTNGLPGNPGTSDQATIDATPGDTATDATATDATATDAAAGDTAATNTTATDSAAAGSPDLQTAKSEIIRDLDEFSLGDVDELDVPVIDQLEDQGYLNQAVITAWTSGFTYKVGDPKAGDNGTVSVPVTVKVRQIGPTIVEGSTPNEIAGKVSALEPQETTVDVQLQRDNDNEWELSSEGAQALTEALVGPMAR